MSASIPPDKKMSSSEVPVSPFRFPTLRFLMDEHHQGVCWELARTRARVEPRATARARARASPRGHLCQTCDRILLGHSRPIGKALQHVGVLKLSPEVVSA